MTGNTSLRIINLLAKKSNRFLHKNLLTSFSQLGSTFNQRPSLVKLVDHNNENETKKNLNDFKKSFTYKLTSYMNSTNTTTSKQIGLFGIKELKTSDGFYYLKQKAEERIKELIMETNNYDSSSQLNKNNNNRNIVQIFDEISNELCRVADLAEFVRTSHPDVHYREAANLSFCSISQIVEKLNTNLKLYNKLKNEYESNTNKNIMDDCDRRVCRLFLIDFELSGIHLDEKTRNKFVLLNDQLIDYLTKFQSNTQVPVHIEAKEIEPKFKNLFKYYSDPIVVDTMYISSGDESLREFVYKSYLNKNSIQEVYFRSILSKRKQIANLCGFKTYSHRANLTSILETPEKIVDFLENCSKSIMPKAKSDFELIKQFKKKTFNSDLPLMQWDVPYLSNMIKKQTFNLDKNHYCNYFSLGSCMEGLNMIFNNLYGVTLEVSQFEPGETWHKDIYKLAVKDIKSNDLLGYIYCDFYSRENKYSNIDCHFTIQCSKLLSVSTKSYQIPIVVLHLNFSPPTLERPTLLTFEMMENLFHEFGHAMHSMFAKTRYQHVSGTRCSTDLAEVPSQLMEYYCREPKILKLFAKHYSTMESLDDETLNKLCESKKLFAACDLQTQLLNSLLDQAYHLTDFEQDNITPLEINEKYTNEFYSLPFVANTYTHLRYNHLIGYGAKYYSYVVSKAIAARIWTDVFEKDPLSREAGENYRKKLLEHGGEIKADKLISSLIGFDLNTNDLVKSLTKNITCS